MSTIDDGNTDLLEGQVISLFAAPGQCLHVVCGRVRLSEAPRWIAEQMVARDLSLSRGAVHVFEAGGWLRLTATEASTLRWRSQTEGYARSS
jgi:hypothetical protein